MAGTLELRDKVAWMPAGWLYDQVLELLASELANCDPTLAGVLLEARTTFIGYCDLSRLDARSFQGLAVAADNALARARANGAGTWDRPSFFPGFIRHFEDLCRMLKEDARMAALG